MANELMVDWGNPGSLVKRAASVIKSRRDQHGKLRSTGHFHNAKLPKHFYCVMQIHSRTFAFQKVQSKSQQ
jgi:hypothetical protein